MQRWYHGCFFTAFTKVYNLSPQNCSMLFLTYSSTESFFFMLCLYKVLTRCYKHSTNTRKTLHGVAWSSVLTKRKLRFLGHVLRLPDDTAVRTALEECNRLLKMALENQKVTWKKEVDNDLSKIGIESKDVSVAAQNCVRWISIKQMVDDGWEIRSQ